MANREGARKWFIPDGYLPPRGDGEGAMVGHEALMLLNTGEKPAHITIDIYYEDRDPAPPISVTVPAKRVKCLRMDNPNDLAGHEIPILTQYALRVTSDEKIIAQFGRLDVTQPNMAYYGCIPYWES